MFGLKASVFWVGWVCDRRPDPPSPLGKGGPEFELRIENVEWRIPPQKSNLILIVPLTKGDLGGSKCDRRPDPPSPLGKGGPEFELRIENVELRIQNPKPNLILIVPLTKGDLGGSNLNERPAPFQQRNKRRITRRHLQLFRLHQIWKRAINLPFIGLTSP